MKPHQDETRPISTSLWRCALVSLAFVLVGACAGKDDGTPFIDFGFASDDGPVTASSEQSPFVKAANLFNDKATKHWMSKRFPFFPEWIEFSYPEITSMGEFGYVGLPWRPNSSPKEFTVFAWVNDAWKPALQVTDGCISQKNVVRNWLLTKEVKSTRFRMQIDSNCGDNEYIGLQKISVDRYFQYAQPGTLGSRKYHKVFPTAPVSGKVVASSSINASNGINNLFDGNEASVWHREVENLKSAPKSWLSVDLGKIPETPVVAMGFSPNAAQPIQFFDTATIQGSMSGDRWQDIAKIRLKDPPQDGHQLFWSFDNPTPYQHYRLLIPSGFAGGTFYSMSEMEMYGAGPSPTERYKAKLAWPKIIAKDRVFPKAGQVNSARVSSFLNASLNGDKLFDGNGETVWHVDVEKAESGEVPWLIMDAGEKGARPVRIIRMWPNAQAAVQFIKSAKLEGSNDGKAWSLMAELNYPFAPIDGSEIAWSFDNDQLFRYYRLTITSGFAGGNFMSLAELELHTQ